MLSTFSIILSNLLQKKAKVIYTFVFCLRGKIVHVSLIAGFRNSSNIDLRKFKCRFFFHFLFDYLKRNQYFNAFFELEFSYINQTTETKNTRDVLRDYVSAYLEMMIVSS